MFFKSNRNFTSEHVKIVKTQGFLMILVQNSRFFQNFSNSRFCKDSKESSNPELTKSFIKWEEQLNFYKLLSLHFLYIANKLKHQQYIYTKLTKTFMYSLSTKIY